MESYPQADVKPAPTKFEKIKAHVQRNKQTYIVGAVGVVCTGIACLVTRELVLRSISSGAVVTAEKGVAVLGNMNTITYISANRCGPPSWVVRCLETGQIFSSQKSAAREMEISPSKLSKHLNGMIDRAGDYTFERICMAA